MKRKARAEQDYWLSFQENEDAEEDRLEFFRYDSHGGSINPLNPVLVGKIRYGHTGEVLREARFDTEGGWVGGLQLVADYATREPFGIRPLVEWFGLEVVRGWVVAFIPLWSIEYF